MWYFKIYNSIWLKILNIKVWEIIEEVIILIKYIYMYVLKLMGKNNGFVNE